MIATSHHHTDLLRAFTISEEVPPLAGRHHRTLRIRPEVVEIKARTWAATEWTVSGTRIVASGATGASSHALGSFDVAEVPDWLAPLIAQVEAELREFVASR